MTNKVALKTVEEFMADYMPVYQPIFPLFLDKSQAYSEDVGSVDFKRADTVGDIRAKHITPKDTEIKQIGVKEGKKSFKKYFLANQFVQSSLQDARGNEDVIAQVLDEHNKQADELLLLGEGTSASTMLNNGLYWSDDANFTLESSVELDKGTAEDHLKDMHSKIMASASKADQVAGRKLILVYGATACEKFDSLYANTDAPFKKVLAEVLGQNFTLVKLPLAVTPSNANGWIVVNLDQIKLHYTVLPQLKAQGVNDEKMYSWHNFLMGSMMVEVLVADGIVRQPVTFEA
jgi:hypothetical protein